MHYLFLGYTTWDGFSYRLPPLVEILQHGKIDGEKFYSSYPGLIKPFLEYIQIPFLATFGLKGLYFGFSTTLLPLSIFSVYRFIHIFSNDRKSAVFGSLVFLSIPFINEQPFSGYIDFAVVGALAFFLSESLKTLQAENLDWKSSCSFFLSALLFSFTRQHGPYIAIILFLGLFGLEYLRLGRSSKSKKIWILITAIFVFALIPSMLLQLTKWIHFGSPIYPYQLQVFGISTASGLPLDKIYKGAGLQDGSIEGYLHSFINSWILPKRLPNNFFDSRSLGAGVILYIFFASLCFFHNYSRKQLRILLLISFTSLLVKDFWLPRYAYGLILIFCIQIGSSLSSLLDNKKMIPFVLLFASIAFQLVGRPFYSLYVMSRDDGWYVRSNFSESDWFLEKGTTRIEIYLDKSADIILISAASEFYLPLYGQELTNQIVSGGYHRLRFKSCETLQNIYENVSSDMWVKRELVVVDQENFVFDRCGLKCVWHGNYHCLAYQP